MEKDNLIIYKNKEGKVVVYTIYKDNYQRKTLIIKTDS